MNRTEFFLTLITFLLASIVFVIGGMNNTPSIILIPVLIIIYGTPFYLFAELINFIGQNTD
ncbi:hypothetical protein DV706_14760 [Natronorubrum bangense]|nr:hypothetical protein DV706_14760 [Natronorubrum bangense]